MSKKLTVAELAADLPTHVDEVKNGETLTITDVTPKAVDQQLVCVATNTWRKAPLMPF